MASTSAAVDEGAVAESLKNLSVSTPDTTLNDLTPHTNPWEEQADTSHLAEPISPLQPTPVDTTFTINLPTEPNFESKKMVEVDQEVLSQFDPLHNKDEQAAKDAWEHSESHPPPTLASHGTDQATSSLTTTPAPNDSASISRPATPSFPGLAAIARSFTLPRGRNIRPLSIDTANTLSPTTLSSFSQQQQRHTRSQSQQVDRREQHPQSMTPSASSPSPQVTRENQDGDQDQPVPFDFQKFLDQMRSKGAEPVAKYLKSFLTNFAKRTFTITDQVKLIHDFLNFISARMQESDLWRHSSDAEFDNALEGMEKLVMNRLYDYTFTPHIARLVPPRPVTADDLERDRVLSQRIALFGWIEEKHLDVPEEDGSKGFMMFAQQELLKINHYKAPRDKLICILNCCKVIFGLLRHLHKEEGADGFLPILIFVVLKANPDHLLSNVEFISRFRNPTKLQSEAGYYLSSLMGAVSFIETMDHTALSNITQEDFERNVEDAIQSLPSTPHTPTPMSPVSTPPRSRPASRPSTPLSSMHVGEESAEPLSMPTPGQTLSEDARRLLQKTGDTISKPLNALGRIFSEALDNAEDQLKSFPTPFGDTSRESLRPTGGEYVPQTPIGVGDGGQQVGAHQPPIQTPYKPRIKRGTSPLSGQVSPDNTPSRTYAYTNQPLVVGPSPQTLAPPRVQSLVLPEGSSRLNSPQLDIQGLQAEIDRAYEQRTTASKETLRQIFPTTDIEIMEWVLEANNNDLGKSIEALLEMSSGS